MAVPSGNTYISQKAATVSFFRGMDIKSKLILVLGLLTLFLIVADLSSEFAKEKNEIGFFQASLENIDDVDAGAEIQDIDIPLSGTIILPKNDFTVQNTASVVHSERGPPVS